MPFQFFEGLPFFPTIVFFYIEGMGFAIALLYLYRIIVKGHRFPLSLFNRFETPVMDKTYNEKIVNGVLRAGGAFKRAHSGDINLYLLWVVVGLLIVLVWIFLQLRLIA